MDQVHGCAEATISHRRSIVRSLHRFLISEDLASHDPMLDGRAHEAAKAPPYTPTLDEVDRLLETADAQTADVSVGLYRQAGYARRAALFEVPYASGMRVSEAVALPASSVGPKMRTLAIRGKGNKQRLVRLHERAVRAVSW